MNNKYQLKSYTKKVYADQITPISVYLTIRGIFAGSILLESSENDDTRNSRSIICAQPIAGIQLNENQLTTFYKNEKIQKLTNEINTIQEELSNFFGTFDVNNQQDNNQNNNQNDGVINGFFGFQSFEAVRYFETKKANLCPKTDNEVAIIDYRLFQYVICFNHFNGEVVFIENTEIDALSTLDNFVETVLTKRAGTFPFKIQSEERVNDTENEFLEKIKTAQNHCKLGDVFQMVLSRRFERDFMGDEFNVYRALRHINPSPYMFFFDYGAYKIFGSSPEAQIRISNNEALINPIAGTYKRTGNKEDDQKLAVLLSEDQKETAEHAMLVDLARNDLNRHCKDVKVVEYKSAKQYSHVIHLVSTVKGTLNNHQNNHQDKPQNTNQNAINEGVKIMADTFPAGTLSGAPKVRAIQLLTEIEGIPRGFYGGSIGFIDFKGDINEAIIIRSFLTKNNKIYYRAGAGVVLKSNPESELKEVDNKLAALRKALKEAENF